MGFSKVSIRVLNLTKSPPHSSDHLPKISAYKLEKSLQGRVNEILSLSLWLTNRVHHFPIIDMVMVMKVLVFYNELIVIFNNANVSSIVLINKQHF